MILSKIQLCQSLKCDQAEAGGLHAELYLACGAEVMLTSNLLADVDLHCVKGKVMELVYYRSDLPGKSGTQLIFKGSKI